LEDSHFLTLKLIPNSTNQNCDSNIKTGIKRNEKEFKKINNTLLYSQMVSQRVSRSFNGKTASF
jgi:hypothetical protein